MKKNLFFEKKFMNFFYTLCFLIMCSSSSWGQLLTWNTYGNLGSETTKASSSNNANIAASNLTKGTIDNSTNGNRFGGQQWFKTGNTAAGSTLGEAIAGGAYIQFIVTPNSGYSFTPTSLVFQFDNSSTGPKNLALRSSLDNYATNR